MRISFVGNGSIYTYTFVDGYLMTLSVVEYIALNVRKIMKRKKIRMGNEATVAYF